MQQATVKGLRWHSKTLDTSNRTGFPLETSLTYAGKHPDGYSHFDKTRMGISVEHQYRNTSSISVGIPSTDTSESFNDTAISITTGSRRVVAL
jgi:hypothetical protein